MSGWIKLHRQIMDSEQLVDPIVRCLFVDLLIRASRQKIIIKRRGQNIPLNPGDVFISLRGLSDDTGLTIKQIRRGLEILEAGHTVSRKQGTLGTVVSICKWSDFQDDDTNQGTPKSGLRAHPGHIQGTPYNKEKKDKKEKKEPLSPSGMPPLSQAKERKTGSRIPPDWQPCEKAWQFARDQGIPASMIGEMADQFRDYWLAASGQKASKRDWLATWRTWVRRETKFDRGRSQMNGQAESPPSKPKPKFKRQENIDAT